MRGASRSPSARFGLERALSLVGILFVACGGSGGSGCGGSGSGSGKIPGGYPVDKRIDSAIQLRVTKTLFDWLEVNGKPLVDQFLPPGGIPVPSGCTGDTQICCGQTCKVDLTFQSLKFDPQPPSTTKFTLRAKLKTNPDFHFKYKSGIINLSCDLALDTGRSGKADIGLTANIVSTVDATTKLANINLDSGSVDILDLDNGDIELKGGFVCDAADVLKGLFIGTLKDQIKKQLAAPLDGLLCQQCTVKDDCSSLADKGCVSGKCMRGSTCMQQLGLESRMDLSSLLKGFGGPSTAAIDFYATAGSYAQVEAAPTGGMSLGMLGGSRAPVKSTCAPSRPAPSGTAGAKLPAYAGNTAPNGMPFHIGAGISKLELDSLGHSFYESGGLCLAVGTEQVGLLSSGLLSALIPSLNDLAPGGNSAIQIVVRPQQPPTFVVGKGTFKTDGMGQKVIDDPLLRLQVKDLTLDFYIYLDERYVRFMRQTADLEIPVGLDVDNMNQIVPILGDLGLAFGNVRVTDTALLRETPATLAKLFPSLLPLLTGSLSDISPIKLPSFAGLDLVPVQITSTADSAGKLAYLGLFLRVKTMGAPLAPLTGGAESPLAALVQQSGAEPQSVETAAELVDLDVPPASDLLLSSSTGRGARAVLRFAGQSPQGGPLEWQYRVDGGLYRPFDDRTLVTVDDAALRLPGEHRIDVRARVIGAPETLDPTPTSLAVFVPRGGAGAVKTASVPTAPAAGQNSAEQSNADLPRGGCSIAPRAPGASGPLGLIALAGAALLGLGLRRRGRRAQAAALSLSLVAAAGVGCTKDNPGDSGTADMTEGDLSTAPNKPLAQLGPNDEIGRYQSAVVRDGKLYISAYDATFGDLAFAEITDPTQPITWLPVDGLPSGDPQVTEGAGYRGGYTEAGDDVGRFTSLQFTSQGVPIIAYQDVTNGVVKLASRPAADKPWQTMPVAAMGEGRGLGAFTQLVLDSQDVPTVAYMTAGVDKGGGKVSSQLVVAKASSVSPTDTASWTKKVVEEAPVSCAGLCATGQACVYIDPAVKDKNATICKATDKTCAPACKTATACIAGKCVDALATPAADLPQGTGLFARLVQAGGVQYLLFYNRAAGALKLATGPDWKVITLAGGDGKSDVGRYIGAAAAADGTLHVAYASADGKLSYRTVKAGVAGAVELIDDGSRTVTMTTESHQVGAGAYLFLDGDKPVVAYQDATAGSLEIARRDGTWKRTSLAAGGTARSRGYYPQSAVLAGRTWLLDVVYDRAREGALSQIEFSPLP